MSYNPYARYRYGGELYHGRTKGSKNGVSNTPGYRAVGKKATGRIVGYRNGTPIYEYTDIAAIREERNKAINDAKRRGRLNVAKAKVAFDKKKFQEQNASRPKTDVREIQRQALINKRNYDRSLIGRIDNATKGTRKAVSGIVGGAARSAGNWLRGRANDVGKAARGAAKNAYNAIGNAWDGKAGKGSAKDDAAAYNRYANDLRALQSGSRSLKTRQAYVRAANRASSAYDNSIKGRLESAGRSISKAAGNAGNWLNDRRKDAGNWLDDRREDAGKAAKKVKATVGNAARNAGNWLDDRREDAGKAAKKVKATVGNAARNAGRAIDRAWDGREGRGDARDTAYEYDLQGRETDAARSREAYNRSIKGRLENLPGNIGRAARGAANAVGGAARDAGKFISDRAGDVRRTANKARRAVEEAWDGKAGKGTAKDEAAKMRNISGKNLTNEQRKMRNDLGDTYAKKYSKSIKGQIENAPKNISKAVKGIGEKISGTASDASKKVSETASKAVKNLNTQVGKVTSEINRVKDSVSAGVNYDKIQKDYQNMYVQYRQLQMRDSKAAKAMEPQMDAMRKAYLEMQRNYNASSLGKASRDAADFVSSVTGSKRKRK